MYPRTLTSNDCVTRAIANTTGLTYQVCFDALTPFRKRTLIHLGSRPKAEYETLKKIYHGLGFFLLSQPYDASTLRTLERELSKHEAYHIGLRGHHVAFVNGITQDWAAGRLHRIKTVHRIVPQRSRG